MLKSKVKGKILDNIYEWRNEDDYIYGSGFFYNYIYNSKSNELYTFPEDSKFFYDKLEELGGYEYRMDNCIRTIDFTMIN